MSTKAAGGTLQRTAERIDALNLRERGMLLAIALLLIWALWHTLLMSPMSERRKQQAQQVEALRNQVGTLNQTVQAMAAESVKDPQAEARLKLEALAAQEREVDRGLGQATSSLIAPQDMGAVLESILARQQRLTLHGLRSLDPEPIDLGADTGIAPIYRHGMAIEVEGGYLELLQFLHALEGLQWKFIWRDLQIERQPDAGNRLRLTLYTMSLREGWLGV
jgi:MSHA biogenesis protein MshJ